MKDNDKATFYLRAAFAGRSIGLSDRHVSECFDLFWNRFCLSLDEEKSKPSVGQLWVGKCGFLHLVTDLYGDEDVSSFYMYNGEMTEALIDTGFLERKATEIERAQFLSFISTQEWDAYGREFGKAMLIITGQLKG